MQQSRLKVLWPRLMKEPGFWPGKMPTLTVSKPFSYEKWEANEPLSFGPVAPFGDVAAMGRVWYLEAIACSRMHARDRLVDSVRKICSEASDGFWRERYRPNADGSASPSAAQKYCEYPAILVRVVLENPLVFGN